MDAKSIRKMQSNIAVTNKHTAKLRHVCYLYIFCDMLIFFKVGILSSFPNPQNYFCTLRKCLVNITCRYPPFLETVSVFTNPQNTPCSVRGILLHKSASKQDQKIFLLPSVANFFFKGGQNIHQFEINFQTLRLTEYFTPTSAPILYYILV